MRLCYFKGNSCICLGGVMAMVFLVFKYFYVLRPGVITALFGV